MRRTLRHGHPCQDCGTKTPCDGQIEQNYDGWPEWICAAFHLPGGVINADWICDSCQDRRDEKAQAEQDEFDRNEKAKTERAEFEANYRDFS